MGQYCTTIVGCLNTKKIGSSTVACTRCNSSLNFQVQNNTCVCAQGYELMNGLCQEACGDGLVNTSQCDDGNLFDGDGCSHDCKI